MTTIVRVIRDIVIRTAILIGFDLGYQVLLDRNDDSPDANIGAGLLAFLIIVVLSGIGGLIDGWRLSFGRVAVIWSVTALLSGVAMTALIDMPYAPFDLDVFLSDLGDLGGFLIGLVLVPALLGGGITALTRPSRSRPPR